MKEAVQEVEFNSKMPFLYLRVKQSFLDTKMTTEDDLVCIQQPSAL
jgi:hypothetical protein